MCSPHGMSMLLLATCSAHMRGASSPANPSLMLPAPLSSTTTPDAMAAGWVGRLTAARRRHCYQQLPLPLPSAQPLLLYTQTAHRRINRGAGFAGLEQCVWLAPYSMLYDE